MPTVREVSPTDLRRHFVELVAAARTGEVVVVRLGGLPAATLVPVQTTDEAVKVRQEVGR